MNIKRISRESKEWNYYRQIFVVGHCHVGEQFYVSSRTVISKLSKEITNCINRSAKQNSIDRHA